MKSGPMKKIHSVILNAKQEALPENDQMPCKKANTLPEINLKGNKRDLTKSMTNFPRFIHQEPEKDESEQKELILQLESKCEKLEKENEEFRRKVGHLKTQIAKKEQQIENLKNKQTIDEEQKSAENQNLMSSWEKVRLKNQNLIEELAIYRKKFGSLPICIDLQSKCFFSNFYLNFFQKALKST